MNTSPTPNKASKRLYNMIRKAPRSKPKPESNDVISKLMGELSILPDHPRVLVTVTHCYIELFVHLLIESKCKNAKKIVASNRDYPHSVKIVLLHEMGIITDWWLEVLHWFRKKRNDAAHNVSFSLCSDDLALFRGMKNTGWKIPLDDPKNLRELCFEIVIGFWNAHVDVFAPHFMPELFPRPEPYAK